MNGTGCPFSMHHCNDHAPNVSLTTLWLLPMLLLLLQANKQWLILSILNKHVAFEVRVARAYQTR
mgnify:CR=1 FL=1